MCTTLLCSLATIRQVRFYFKSKKCLLIFVFIPETAIFAPSKMNDTRFGSSAG